MQTAQDRRAIALLLLTSAFAYAYFYQGDGWTLQSHLATIRSLVERRTFQISPGYADTGDVAVANGRTYSNKPPGLALIGSVPYAIFAAAERSFGLDPHSRNVELANQYLLTLILCGVPACAIVVMLYCWFRHDGADVRVALTLASAFAFGSLLWPYAGMMFNHLLVAALLFGAWAAIQSRSNAGLIGALLGVAGACEYLVWPLLPLYLAFEWLTHRRTARLAIMLIAPLAALLGLLVYQWQLFGNALLPTYAYDNAMFQRPDALLGKFHWPKLERLILTLFHPKHGLLILCPIFAIPLLARTRLDRPRIVAVLIIAYFTSFVLCYAYWLGGWGVGVRFLIPALPFVFIFARAGFERFPRVSEVLIVISILNMLTITAVRAHFPAGLTDPNEGANPLLYCYRSLVHGDVSQGRDAFNLPMLPGARGWWSMVPLAIVFLEAAWMADRYHRAGEKPKR